jgi:omega-6 fatty acid desaturase (delta-12 desaturase)
VDRVKEILSIIFTDIMLILIIIAAKFTIGLRTYLAIQLPVIYLAAAFGVWIFYIHHQFEDVYWSHNDKYDVFRAAMDGSSFYKLPAIFRWFSGNIGYHHVHHMNFRIPNFNLKDCYDQTSQLQQIAPTTVSEGFRCTRLALWDEAAGKLVSFDSLNDRKT